MKSNTTRTPRLAPLPVDYCDELKEIFEGSAKSLGFIPNSILIMQRKPKLVKAFRQMSMAVFDPNGEVSVAFKRLLAYVVARTHGCQYCMAHNAGGSLRAGIDEGKLAAVWEFRSSPLFTDAERVALEYAIAAASQPNDVTDELFADLLRHWSEGQVVEITALVSYFGFLNRWNDSLATPLEDEPIAVAEKHIAQHGWTLGKHGR